jgi:hypothetical protein
VDLLLLWGSRRLARSALLGIVVIIVSVVVPSIASGTAARSPSHDTVPSFLTLAERGISGTFFEEYYVTQGPLSGTVDLAQEGSPGQLPLTEGSVRWSFLYLTPDGSSRQWIERGSRAWDCLRGEGATGWTCSGPGTFEPSNGLALATTPYIPGVVLDDISAVTDGKRMHRAEDISFSTSTSPRFGPLQCLKAYGTTSCLDRAGVLVSQRGGSYWTTVTLLRRSASVPASAFTLEGASTSSGRSFVAFQ